MSYAYVMGLLGGLALFLYGIQMMSTALEAAAGNKMKVILEKLTTNRKAGCFHYLRGRNKKELMRMMEMAVIEN